MSGYAFKKKFTDTLWGSLAIVVDSLLRTLFLAYFLSITKAYTFLFVLAYFIILYLTICISKKQMKLGFLEIIWPMFSFTCSAIDDPFIQFGYKLRFRSKMVFSVLFVLSFAFVIVTTHTDSLSHIGLSMNSSDVSLSQPDCKDICGKEYDNFCLERWKHLPQSQHTNIQIILSVLFGLSILEWILESCTDFMPYNQFYKKSDSNPKGGLISEGILTLVPLTKKGVKYLP